jgi:hypothetical protein
VWPPAKAPKSPCPTLKVISAVTALLDKKEELQRGIGKGREGTQRFKGGMLPAEVVGEEQDVPVEVDAEVVSPGDEAVLQAHQVQSTIGEGSRAQQHEGTADARAFEAEVEGVIVGSGRKVQISTRSAVPAQAEQPQESVGRAPKVTVRPKKRGTLTSQ